MIAEMKERVVNLLESYSERERQIALLHCEMQHSVRVSPEEMIDGMSLGHGDGVGGSKGHISDKTMYIALNYQERMDRLNAEVVKRDRPALFEVGGGAGSASVLCFPPGKAGGIRNKAVCHFAELYAYRDGLV